MESIKRVNHLLSSITRRMILCDHFFVSVSLVIVKILGTTWFGWIILLCELDNAVHYSFK